MEYLLIFISAIFVNNIVLSQFLGICPFLGVSKKVDTALGMSGAVAFVMTLAHGGEDIYSGWMKNKRSAMISCNDGFRPVSFLIETLDEEAGQ